jgi:hypothetical protein
MSVSALVHETPMQAIFVPFRAEPDPLAELQLPPLFDVR